MARLRVALDSSLRAMPDALSVSIRLSLIRIHFLRESEWGLTTAA